MSKIVDTILSRAAGISSAWSLAAFAIAILLFLLWRRTDRKLLMVGIGALVLLGTVPVIGDIYQKQSSSRVYRVRAIVLGTSKVPVDDAKVWSSVGGEPKKVSGGWEFTIPTATRPADGKLIVYASQPDSFLNGNAALILGDDMSPTVTIQLAADVAARLRGVVVDEGGHPIEGAAVSIVGHEETARTNAAGSFSLPAFAADGQQVQVTVKAPGHAPFMEWAAAGETGVTLVASEAER